MDNLQIFQNLVFLIILSPILVTLAWNLWLSYVQTDFLRSYKWVLLEIKPPKEVLKSPMAMELVFGALYQTGGTGTWFDRYWKGNLRNYFSLEIVSTEGSIHFYIRTHKKFKKLIESQIYAQYPQAEVFEVSDYTENFPEYDPDKIELFGSNLELAKEDPYPIKTYVDYGLDRAIGTLEEEQRIDPITPTLEFMGSVGSGEHIWFQIIIRAATDRFTINDKGEEKEGKKWTDKAKEIIKELNSKLTEKDENGNTITRKFTKGELAVIDSIERNANKFGFDSGIRVMYLTEKGKFNPDRIAGLTGILKQYSTLDFNSFKVSVPTITSFDFPWQDIFGNKIHEKKAGLFYAYKARGFFYGGFDFATPSTYFTHPNKSGAKPFILSTEELATLFHLPGRVAETPTFERVETKKADAPSNLPI